MSYLKVVESRIQEALAQGAFQGLQGEGRPLNLERGQLAGDLWIGHHILENEGLLPAWLELAKDIERDLEQLQRIDEAHQQLVNEVAFHHGSLELLSPRIARQRAEYERVAREVRRKQDQFNIDAPSPRCERPGIWVEYHLERLDRRLTGLGSQGTGP